VKHTTTSSQSLIGTVSCSHHGTWHTEGFSKKQHVVGAAPSNESCV